MADEHGEACPLAAVDKRLSDVHRQWHAAEEAYFDPEGFRVAIQTAIQTLRTVTFILQSNKRLIPDFDNWYQGWRDQLAADDVMRWMVDARNKIEKQGDLEAQSTVRASVIASYLDEGPVTEVQADLFDENTDIFAKVPTAVMRDHIIKHGYLMIERRWVENTLPAHELLDAVAYAYGQLSLLVDDAHLKMGLPTPTTISGSTGVEFPRDREGRLPCMVGHADRRQLKIALADGAPMRLAVAKIEMRPKAEVEERYGIKVEDMMGPSGANEDIHASLFDTARTLTLKDGKHVPIFFLLREGKLVEVQPVEFIGQADKYALVRHFAHEARRKGADAVIFLGEQWRAMPDPERPYMRAGEAEDRKEFLSATLVQQNGDPVMLSAEMTRTEDSLRLGGTERITGGAHFMFAPFYEAWGKPIPDNWMEQSLEAMTGQSDAVKSP